MYCNATTIVREFQRSWAVQYTAIPTPPVNTPWFYNHPITTDTTLAADTLTLPVDEEEFMHALNQLNNTAPGTDGINACILRTLPDDVLLNIRMHISSLITDVLPILEVWKNAQIILLPKPGSPADPVNYWPISLLQVSYKLYTSVLTNRLQTLPPTIFTLHQLGFCKGMSAQLALRTVVDAVEEAKLHNKEIHVAFIDFKKAFDSISHHAVYEALAHYGTGDRFGQVIKQLYHNCMAHININGTNSNTFPILRGVRQGDMLSLLLFVIGINPLLDYINKSGNGYVFNNATTIPAVTYCDNIALISNSTNGITRNFDKVVCFGCWAGLEINAGKSAYTCARARLPANLVVPTHHGVCNPITTLKQHQSYKYMGVWLNLDTCWKEQMTYLKNKVTKYQTLLRHRRLSTDNKIMICNMVTNAYAGHSMGVVQYPIEFLRDLQNVTLATLKQTMRIPSNMDDAPFFMPIADGGRGLVNLLDLQAAVTCASTFHELNSNSLSKLTTTATWTHAYALPNSNISHWLEALKGVGLTAWPKLRDINIIGHTVDNPHLARALVLKGVTRWSQLAHQNELMDKLNMERVIGVPLSNRTYNDIRKAACLPNSQMVNAQVSTVLSIEKAVTEMHRTLTTNEEMTDYHYHYPTDTISVFTDGSCVGSSVAGSIYLGKGSKHNKAFSLPVQPISTLAELYAIEAALTHMPKGHNIMVVTDSKAAIDTIKNYHTWGPSKQQRHVARHVTLRIHALIGAIKGEYNKAVTFQHIYSHIKNKKLKAQKMGDEAINALNYKLDFLSNTLHGDLNEWVGANEEADRLASEGHLKPLLFSRWTVYSQANPVTLFDGNGAEVNGNVRKRALAHHARNWRVIHSGKPVRGSLLRDRDTDYHTTHAALNPKAGATQRSMSDFLHKARYGALSVRSIKHHTYWHSHETEPTPKSPPPGVTSHPNGLRTWRSRQERYRTQACPNCPCKETMTHPFSSECPFNKETMLKVVEDVRNMIRAEATTNINSVHHLPIWFYGHAPLHPTAFEPFRKLHSYNRHMGALGYVPRVLKKSLEYYGVTNKKTLIHRISVRIAQGARDTWTLRCRVLIRPATLPPPPHPNTPAPCLLLAACDSPPPRLTPPPPPPPPPPPQTHAPQTSSNAPPTPTPHSAPQDAPDTSNAPRTLPLLLYDASFI